MRKRKLVLLVIGTALVLMEAIGVARAGSTTINYLPMGDSITSQGQYLAPLNNLLSSQGYTPNMIANEGHSGYVIAHQYTFNGTQYTSGRSGLLDSITSFMNHPTVNADNGYILLMIGTNDVDTGFQLGSDNVQYRMGQLITSITNIAPRAHLIVAQIVPNLGSIAKDTAVRQFNTDVAASVATTKAAGKNVSLVDMYDAFHPNLYQPYTSTPNPYMGDTLHPNATGGTAMAQVWFDGIQATPEPSSLALLASSALATQLLGVWRWKRKNKFTLS